MDFSRPRQVSKNAEEKAEIRPAPSSRRGWYVAIIIIGLLVTVAAALFVLNLQAKNVRLPEHVAGKLSFAAYLPHELPGQYKLDVGSFSIEEESVLVFQAISDAGSPLFFSQQPKPSNFNFEDFYAKQLQDASMLSDAKYNAAWGRMTGGGSIMLSVVTNETWILITTTAPLGENDLLKITNTLHKAN